MNDSSLQIVKATSDDAAAFAAILTQAAQWRVTQGFTNDWPIPFPKKFARNMIANTTVFLGKLNSKIVSCVQISLEDFESTLWNDKSKDAGYIYKLAVINEVHGQQIGTKMLEYAAQFIKQQGKTKLRLDCNSNNTGIRQYYEAQGFQLVGNLEVSANYTAALYERPIETNKEQ